MDFRWVRARDGALCGVCKGVARALGISTGICRLLWMVSVLCVGGGLLLYVMLAIALPREDRVVEAMNPRLLGVCAKLARRNRIEVGVLRFILLCVSLLSFGATVIGYLVLYFILDDEDQRPTQ